MIEAKSESLSRCLSRKFETPMARTLSCSNNSSKVRQALSIYNSNLIYQFKALKGSVTNLLLMGTWPVQQEQVQIVGAQKFKTFGDRFHAATRPIVARPDLRLSTCLVSTWMFLRKTLSVRKISSRFSFDS